MAAFLHGSVRGAVLGNDADGLAASTTGSVRPDWECVEISSVVDEL